jgi:hypothetical protein
MKIGFGSQEFQTLAFHYLTQHFPHTFADVFAECDMKLLEQLFVMDTS